MNTHSFPDDNTVSRSLESQRTMRGDAPAPARRLRAGDMLLGRYTVLSELGESGMGVVYKCMDQVGGIEVAVKCLPTEAQWEYACRAGSSGPFSGTGRLDDMGWHDSNSDGKTHPVAQKKANAWGLFDMHGNVWEWCADGYGPYPSGTVTNPFGSASGSSRVSRGGSWRYYARHCRSANRDNGGPGSRRSDLGFRVALVPVP